MPTARVKYLVEDVDRHGNVRLYVRVPGTRKIRLRCRIGSPEFFKEYQAAIEGAAAAPARGKGKDGWPAGSIAALIIRFQRSADWMQLHPDTRKVRKRIFDAIIEKDGPKPVALLEPRHLRARRDQMMATPSAANTMLKAWRQLFSWAMEADEVTRNPARDVKFLREGKEGHHTWSEEEVQAFEAKHPVGTQARLALAIFLYTGVRISDACLLGRANVKGEKIAFTEVKDARRRPKHREIPLLPALGEVLARSKTGDLTWLANAKGTTHSVKTLGAKMRAWCNEAGLKHCSAHGLRKAGAVRAAEAGATEQQLMAIFGWDSPRIAALYTRKANKTRLAKDAMHLLGPNKIVPLKQANK